jgi:chromosome segregation ATPase
MRQQQQQQLQEVEQRCLAVGRVVGKAMGHVVAEEQLQVVQQAADALVQRHQQEARRQLLLRLLVSGMAATAQRCSKRKGRKQQVAESRLQQNAALLAKVRDAAARLQQRLTGKSRQLESKKKELGQHKHCIAQLYRQQREDLWDIQDRNAAIEKQQQLTEQASFISQLQQQLSDTQTALADERAAAAGLQQRCAALESDCDELQQQLSDTDDELAQAQHSVAELQQELGGTKEQLAQAWQEVDHLEADKQHVG